jgi:hypothetical protein
MRNLSTKYNKDLTTGETTAEATEAAATLEVTHMEKDVVTLVVEGTTTATMATPATPTLVTQDTTQATPMTTKANKRQTQTQLSVCFVKPLAIIKTTATNASKPTSHVWLLVEKTTGPKPKVHKVENPKCKVKFKNTLSVKGASKSLTYDPIVIFSLIIKLLQIKIYILLLGIPRTQLLLQELKNFTMSI